MKNMWKMALVYITKITHFQFMKYDIYITGITFDPILPTSLGLNSTCWPSTGVLVTLAGIFSPDGPKFNPTHLHEFYITHINCFIYILCKCTNTIELSWFSSYDTTKNSKVLIITPLNNSCTIHHNYEYTSRYRCSRTVYDSAIHNANHVHV